jgi:hypothetical protein
MGAAAPGSIHDHLKSLVAGTGIATDGGGPGSSTVSAGETSKYTDIEPIAGSTNARGMLSAVTGRMSLIAWTGARGSASIVR